LGGQWYDDEWSNGWPALRTWAEEQGKKQRFYSIYMIKRSIYYTICMINLYLLY